MAAHDDMAPSDVRTAPRCITALGVCGALLGAAPHAHAAPQFNLGVQAGTAGMSAGSPLWQRTVFYGGVHGDVLFGRERSADLGLGPYLSVSSAALDDLRVGTGASLQWPITEAVPVVLSLGGYHRFATAPASGVSGRLFVGSRSFNFHSSYAAAIGLTLGVDRDLGARDQTALVAVIHFDALWLGIPFIALYSWATH